MANKFSAPPLTKAVADKTYLRLAGDQTVLPQRLINLLNSKLNTGGGSGGGSAAFAIVPETYGAKGDGVTNDTTALQNALNAARDISGGSVYLSPGKTYCWKGDLVIPNGVYLICCSTRQSPVNGKNSGLFALDATARLHVGSWSVTDAGATGGAQNLYVNGNYVAGGDGTVPSDGLVIVEGVSLHVDNLHVVRSSGNGTVFNATQNSDIVGLYCHGHVGDAVVICGGAGALSFLGGHWGSARRALNITQGNEDRAYPFGPVQNNFFGTIFELYPNAKVPSPAGCVEVGAGQQNVFYGCNFTGNDNGTSNNALLKVHSTGFDGTQTLVSSTIILDSCVWAAAATDYDNIRIVGIQYVAIAGFHEFTQGNAIICQDSGFAKLTMLGEWYSPLPVSSWYRTINGGALVNWRNEKSITEINRFSSSMTTRWQRDTDDVGNFRGYLDRDFNLVWGDGTGAVRGSLVHDGAGRLKLTGQLGTSGGQDVATGQSVVYSADQAVTVDTAQYSTWSIAFGAFATAVLTLANAIEGREITLVLLLGVGNNSITWPSNVKFSTRGAPDLSSASLPFLTIKFRYVGDDTGWIEMFRSE